MSISAVVEPDREPDAWAFWSAWEGTPELFVDVASRMEALGNEPFSIEIETRAGLKSFASAEEFRQEQGARPLRGAHRARLVAKSADALALLEFRRRSVGGANRAFLGVPLRLWALGDSDVKEVERHRDELAVDLDPARGRVGGKFEKGSGTQSFAAAEKRLSEERDGVVALLGGLPLALSFYIAAVFHRFLPESRFRDFLLYCTCKQPLLLVLIPVVLGFVGAVLARRFLPPVEISRIPSWLRLGKLFAPQAIGYLVITWLGKELLGIG